MSPFPSSIFQEVSHGTQSVFSSNSNLNSPTPQEQSGDIVGADETDGDIDGVEDGEMEGREEAEGFMDGTDDNVGIKEGEVEGLMDGDEEEVGIEDTDGDVDGKCDRLGSQSISIFDGSKYASHRAYTLGLLLGLKNSV